MTNIYHFRTDAKSRQFCDMVAAEMVKLFGFSTDEAIGRISSHWAGMDFGSEGADIRYHQDSTFWAKDITYGPNTYWWTAPPGLTPTPYP